jgi:hypothetical protein
MGFCHQMFGFLTLGWRESLRGLTKFIHFTLRSRHKRLMDILLKRDHLLWGLLQAGNLTFQPKPV